MKTTYKQNTKSFVELINNGWLHTPKESIDKVYKLINEMILNKKTESESFSIYHAKYLKKYINKVLSGGVEIEILDNRVCTTVKIHININYDDLTDGEYYNLRKTIEKNNIQ